MHTNNTALIANTNTSLHPTKAFGYKRMIEPQLYITGPTSSTLCTHTCMHACTNERAKKHAKHTHACTHMHGNTHKHARTHAPLP